MTLALLIGFFAGLRALTPLAASAWGVHLGWLRVDGILSYLGSLVGVAVCTILAGIELVTDKLPTTPSRTVPVQLAARLVTGALSGGCVYAASGGSALVGIVGGAIGALAGTYAGYNVRRSLVRALNVPDLYIALAEDIVAVVGSFLVVSRF